MRTCIACILDLQLLDVPHFVNMYKDYAQCTTQINKWLAVRDLTLVELPHSNIMWSTIGYHLISGPSPRSPGGTVWHCVVGKNGKPLHDPHNSNDMLLGDPTLWIYEIFVKNFEME